MTTHHLTPPPRRSPRGNVTIELALVLPLLMVLLTGIVDFGWYLSRASRFVTAVRDGTRVGTTYADDAGATPESAAERQVRASLTDAGIPCADACKITAVVEEVGGVPSLTVSASAPFSPLTGLLPMPPEMGARLTMALEVREPPGAG